MKVLFFSSYFLPYLSGLTLYPYKILKHMCNKNSVTVLTFPHKNHLSSHEIISSIHVFRMPFFLKISKGYVSLHSFFYFLKEVRKNDTIILNIPNAEGLPLAILAKLFGKKVISLVHCRVVLRDGFVNRIVNALLDFSVLCQLLLSNYIVGYPDYLRHIVPWNIFAKKIRTTLPPIETLPVDKKVLASFMKKKKSGIWIGYVGRIASEKGLEYLITALSNLKEIIPHITLVIAGPGARDVVGESFYQKKIEGLFSHFQIKHYFFENLTKSELGSFYKAIDLLVLPSINGTEAFGMVQAEAMLLGVPVIASNLPGVRIPVTQTGMGILVPPKNPVELADAIMTVLKEKKRYVDENNIDRAKHLFNIHHVFTFYDNLLALP